jgi:multimeric flavodoxin WrbA
MGKKLILHDLSGENAERLFSAHTGENTVFPASPSVRACVGCFGCWLKTPGNCVIDDRGGKFARLISEHDEFIIISRLVFGGFSPDVKAVLDRSIGYMLPFFRVVNGETNHTRRYGNTFDLRCVFYGAAMTEYDREIARSLSAANALNFGAARHECCFYPSVDMAGAAA